MSNPYPNGDIKPGNRPSVLPNNRNAEALSREYVFQQQQQQQQHYRPTAPNVPPHRAEPSPYHRGTTQINRSKSLSRPERQRPRTGMINRNPSTRHQQAKHIIDNQRRSQYRANNRDTQNFNQPMSSNLQQQLQQQKQQQLNQPISSRSEIEEKEKEPKVLTSWWAWAAFLSTCCFPNYIIRVWFGKTNKNMQQAWREKLTLCYLVGLLCGVLAYIIYGLHIDLCSNDRTNIPYAAEIDGQRVRLQRPAVSVFGQVYPFNTTQAYFGSQNLELTDAFMGMEIGGIFEGDTKNACAAYQSLMPPCSITSPTGVTISKPDGSCLSVSELNQWSKSEGFISFDWIDVRPSLTSMQESNAGLIVDTIVNLTTYFESNQSIFGPEVDKILKSTRGNDMTYALLYTSAGKEARACIVAKYGVGVLNQETGGCIADNLIMTVMFSVIIIIIIIRYSMACLFQWVIARRLTKPGGRSNWLAWRSIKGGNDDPANHIPGPYNDYGPMAPQNSAHSLSSNGNNRSVQGSNHGLSGNNTEVVETELYTVMLVTCYSEGEEGLKTTMDSLSNTTYSNKHKIFFVIADGLITGAGESKSTPEIVVDMMDLTPAMANPKPVSYLAVADGEKQLNMAKVYAGHYNGTACVTIVKCGTEEEQKGAKAGNRGKRDSQVILMSFFQRVLFNDRFCELDYEIFWKMTWLMNGVTPDKFETVLMVDADTEVLPDALTYMIAAMANDITIMGLCGETRIANKRTSWVTAIQVFEYYISHHYAKAFESLFGMVTCLPGCFSMYRIKSPKNGAWVPILANPDIILEYNENVVTTLHEKNLLLLGEDRFLSTLMLRTFPKRQMMFVPQARCRTVVPDEFSVLLSQRRRWINSTVHNLMELVLVSDLCGIACLSMQFSVFIDLIGTLVLPAAIVMTVYLIVITAITPDPQWQSIGLLIAILVLPAILIALTTMKFVYIGWMIIYIIALPIWNLVLPLYSYWHFDDFSWGATRVVVGEKKGETHGDKEGKFDSKRLVMKKWEEWEADRTGQRSGRKFQLRSPQNSPAAFDSVRASPSPFFFK